MTCTEQIREKFPEAVLESSTVHGDESVTVRRESLQEVLGFLRDGPGFDLPLDATAVDRLGLGVTPRFVVVYHLRRLADGRLIRVRVPVPDDDASIPSAVGVFRGLDWAEREVWDLFGIRFDGHPDLRRILLYPEFVGHPLRKDYPIRGYQPLMDMPGLRGEPVPGREE